ncbi:cytochrome c oxidase subunit I [Sphingomonas sp. AR_OL41]|uniref:cytochrome c oxidase subunit I n=1 Tax=Sphingomonas sp. AR_OL41 TaxID=3042729 RepID=UPI0024801699|nr:cytochrome c oxidase subunit I [Sphingomonas sp. AR_OL41]MDH7974203.1 cytochrome c oxidase subunit I [Sphingomonas sp. AR_OL41]
MSTSFNEAALARGDGSSGPVDPKPPLSPNPPEIAERLEAAWGESPGLKGWFGSVDHKVIGIRYLFTAFVFLVVGGCEALVMRIQLARPDATVLTPEQYNQLFSMHGVTMIFLYALPILSGFSNFLWPLMLGSRDMAFPRLNALSYWLFLVAGIFLYLSFPFGAAPDGGWFAYVPNTAAEFSPGPNIDVYCLGLIFLGISTTVGSANFVVTLLRMRAPGMSINRLPIIVWGTLTASVANLFAVPAVSLACLFLWFDRNLGTHFFEVSGGGQPLLWQHLFWIFGHPWVYAIVLPAMGMVSDALPVHCRRPLVGYTLVAMATVATMVVGFGVWLHHMFATGVPTLALSFFSAASFVIAIPSAVSVFAWIATIWTGRARITVPFLFFTSVILLFVIGGVSGVMTASLVLDWQLTDTYFIVAHLHYVLIGINLFAVVGAVYHWFPKMRGRMMDERLGRWVFGLMFIGFNFAFLPMHWLGLVGMPRRVWTYGADMGFSTTNMIITLGAFLFAFGLLLFFINIWQSARSGRLAGPNPWDGPTLEWAIASPPPVYNFAVIPLVASRHPLWEDRLGDTTERSVFAEGFLLDQGKETLAVTPLDGVPDVILKMPGDSWLPFALSVSLMPLFGGLLTHSVALAAIGAVTALLILILWFAPHTATAEDEAVRVYG